MPAHDANLDTSKGEKSNTNRFAGLAVFEPSQEFLDAPDIERPTKAQSDDAVYEAETKDSLRDAMFALSSTMVDMAFLRDLVRLMWSLYKADTLDIVSVAITTNTAINIVSNMLDDIKPLLDKNGGAFTVLKTCHLIECFQGDWETKQGKFDFDTYDKGYGDYLALFELFNNIRKIRVDECLPCDPKDFDRSNKTGLEKYKEDRKVLAPLLFQFEDILDLKTKMAWPIQDELLRGLSELRKTKKVPLYLIFATRILLDITYELGKDVERPFQALVSQVLMMSEDLQAHLNFHANVDLDPFPNGRQEAIRRFSKDIHFLGNPAFRPVVDVDYKTGSNRLPFQKSHLILRISPVISGLFIYNFRCRYQRIGLMIANNHFSIQSCKHLYNALLQENMLRDRWRDMDIVSMNLSPESFFVGYDEPKSMAECWRKFCFQLGRSPTMFMKNKRKNASDRSLNGPRYMKQGCPVLTMFEAQYVDNTRPVGLTLEHISHIVSLSSFEKGGLCLEVFNALHVDPDVIREKLKLRAQRRAGGKRADKSDMLPAHQLLQPLILSLENEVLEYAFPYMALHRWCVRLLGDIKEAGWPVLAEFDIPEAFDTDNNKNVFLVPWILWAASGLETGIRDRRLLKIAAQVMTTFLDSGAGAFVNQYMLRERIGVSVYFGVNDGNSDDEELRNVVARGHPCRGY